MKMLHGKKLLIENSPAMYNFPSQLHTFSFRTTVVRSAQLQKEFKEHLEVFSFVCSVVAYFPQGGDGDDRVSLPPVSPFPPLMAPNAPTSSPSSMCLSRGAWRQDPHADKSFVPWEQQMTKNKLGNWIWNKESSTTKKKSQQGSTDTSQIEKKLLMSEHSKDHWSCSLWSTLK